MIYINIWAYRESISVDHNTVIVVLPVAVVAKVASLSVAELRIVKDLLSVAVVAKVAGLFVA